MAEPTKLNALQLLSADHRKVEALFETFEKARGAERKHALAQQICTELRVHALIEEEIFYPSLRGEVDEDMLNEAYVEHDAAKVLINQIEAATPDDDYFEAKVTVLQEEIAHHVSEEERRHGSLFAQARKAGLDLEALGERMNARKLELTALAKRGELPPARPTTFGASSLTGDAMADARRR
ncbi:hemerythrin domain-containing protein [Caulobacter sp. 17J80-11]|uniref:hemerythrin domain-containing protein n=1 Tax=Caulobacter sp. 17J80-11 TaxID=2763502 RepID=UPI001653A979|nr:hemerythrin domain-containing protein [Caulobacter sp. 17J80-11]MBC6981712.1 hemerythrin domain-containing protein [Caulobacter sp. 17J80-11]